MDGLRPQKKVYRCYASREEREELRKQQPARGEKPRYDGRWRPERAAGRPIPAGVVPVTRFRNPDVGMVAWNDLVKGPISFSNTELDDLVIARGDGIPTYNFAVVVDDIDMKISHVLRGDDHVNNTPRQINIYRAILGERAALPKFGHVPMILGPDGQKLSKRHGAVSVLQYRDDGFLPEALFNYLARLGWSHGDVEKFSREELTTWFDLDHVNRAPAQYDLAKLLWLNGEYMKEAAPARLAHLAAPLIEHRSPPPRHAGEGPGGRPPFSPPLSPVGRLAAAGVVSRGVGVGGRGAGGGGVVPLHPAGGGGGGRPSPLPRLRERAGVRVPVFAPPPPTARIVNSAWGYSSAGRALAWHARGQRFDPAYLHHNKQDSPQSPSSRGLGHDPFTVVTGVRIPFGTPVPSFPPVHARADKYG